jgi:hypothetical protein
MAASNPLASLIQALSKRPSEPNKKDEVALKHREVLSRLKSIQDWQKTANMKFRTLTTTLQRIDSIQSEKLEEEKQNNALPDIKKTLEQINARLAPKVFSLKEQGDFQYDPLAPQGKQVTKLSRQGKAVVGATNKDIEVVLKKAAYIFNREIESRKESNVTKVETQTEKNSLSVFAKMARTQNTKNNTKKDFTQVYKNLSYEKSEDDPVFLLSKNVDKNFKQVFKELKTLRALIINSSGGLDLPGRLGRGAGRGGKPPTQNKPGGAGGGPRGASSTRFGGLGGTAATLAVGGGLGIYNAIRDADTNRTSGDALEQGLVNAAAGTYFGVQAAKSVKDAVNKTKAASRLARMRGANPNALKGTAKQASKWSKFLKWLGKRSPKIAAKVGARLATSAGLMAVPVIGWAAAAVNMGMTAWTMYNVYELWKEYNALSEEEQAAEEDGTATASADSTQKATTDNNLPSSSPDAEKQGAAAVAVSRFPNGAYTAPAASTEELKGVSESGSAKEAMKFFQDKGWTKEQSAGIVANLMAESSVNMKTDDYNPGEQAYGIAQWRPDRQEIFKRVYGKPIQEAGFTEQLNFVNWELNNTEKKAATALRTATDPSTAAAIVDSMYERSSGEHRQKRIDYANQLLDAKYVEKVSASGSRASASPTMAPPPAPAPGSTGTMAPAGTVRGTINRGTSTGSTRETANTAIAAAQKEIDVINKGYEASVGALQKALGEGRITKEQFQEQVIKLDESRRKAIKEPAARASALKQAKEAIAGTTPTATDVTPTPAMATVPQISADNVNATSADDSETVVSATPLPAEEADYALKQLGMLNDPEKPEAVISPVATPTAPAVPSVTSNVTELDSTTTSEEKTSNISDIIESKLVRNLLGEEKSTKVVSVVRAAERLRSLFTPAQERTSGDKLSEDSSTFESNKMAAAIQPVVLNNMVQQSSGGCRFVPTPPAPMPPVDIKNADASIRSSFNRDRWA